MDIYCKKCGEKMFRYDKVKRIVRTEYGRKSFIFIERYYCKKCRSVIRVLPDELVSFKHYTKKVIKDCLNNDIYDELKYEDYPCDMTKQRWKKTQNLHSI